MQQLRLRAMRRLPINVRQADEARATVRVLRAAAAPDILPEAADSYPLLPLDQPAEFARLVREFTTG